MQSLHSRDNTRYTTLPLSLNHSLTFTLTLATPQRNQMHNRRCADSIATGPCHCNFCLIKKKAVSRTGARSKLQLGSTSIYPAIKSQPVLSCTFQVTGQEESQTQIPPETSAWSLNEGLTMLEGHFCRSPSLLLSSFTSGILHNDALPQNPNGLQGFRGPPRHNSSTRIQQPPSPSRVSNDTSAIHPSYASLFMSGLAVMAGPAWPHAGEPFPHLERVL